MKKASFWLMAATMGVFVACGGGASTDEGNMEEVQEEVMDAGEEMEEAGEEMMEAVDSTASDMMEEADSTAEEVMEEAEEMVEGDNADEAAH